MSDSDSFAELTVHVERSKGVIVNVKRGGAPRSFIVTYRSCVFFSKGRSTYNSTSSISDSPDTNDGRGKDASRGVAPKVDQGLVTLLERIIYRTTRDSN